MIQMLSISRINLIRSKATKNYNNKDKYNDVNYDLIENVIDEDNKTDIADLIEANNKAR